MDESKVIVKSKFPYRLGFGLLFGLLGWLIPYLGVNSTLLPAKIQQIAPNEKVQIIAVLATIAMVVATIANIVEGALSDRTVSRLGKRNPWIIFGMISTLICFFFLTKVTTITGIIINWSIFQIALNMMVAPIVAFIADKSPKKYRGSISAFYGVGMNIGTPVGTIIASQYLTNINIGIYIFMGLEVIFTITGLLLIGDGSNKGEKVKKLSGSELLEAFIFPIHGDVRDFYLAVFGKLLFVSAQFVITGYQLYIFIDYMKLSSTNATHNLSIMSVILLITGVSFAILGGPLADKFHSLKLLVAVSTIAMGLGVVIPAIDPAPWTMFIYAGLSGAAMGMYNSVDQALNVSVLPNPNNAAKDLGIVNLANSLGQVLGPIVASIIIGFSGYRMMFPAAGIMCLVGAGLILMIKKVR
ncbi:major facilitator superfamily protein [Paucilactobacillus oligofermentans DSM 15707 = LMG 22743]|uniref:Major facilitator superfamily protein n=1 Tax=Paucilactobacillus oligofermentans DSM 15707 = LMG 22743 TaxID=1423778 RepID=A0A0R1RPY8_9LACO|nr:MFS transporter [Paucilactobacillus oligofermentans]KRL55459.1 major facilitator superfamily protein [Paucilactobacillus oligofermentans DSM 15707 = LMG 22743]CUS25555.1 Major facilitator superfamily permease [Paucilactobacillus oligofermentans DSM 15707 = LMG 22743]